MGPTNPGSVLGKYHILATLGRGGMSSVYVAVARGPAGFHKLLVLKELTADLSQAGEFVRMFRDEARLTALLSHPNVVQTYEVAQHEQRHFIVMEYLRGQPLSEVLRRAKNSGGMPAAFAARIVADVCEGLHHAHELTDLDGKPLHVVHRDISPHNVFLTYEGHVKVLDFGIAKTAARSVVTETGVLKGKISYMSPEQARGVDVDRRADVFATGVALYEALANARMWRAEDGEVDILRALMQGPVASSPRAVRPDVPEALDAICRRALAIDREARYPTCAEMARDLEAFLETVTPRVTAGDLGARVCEMFHAEREAVEKSVQRQLRALEEKTPERFAADSLPNLTLGTGLAVTPSSQATRVESDRKGGRAKRRPGALAVAGVVALGVAATIGFAVTRRGTARKESVAGRPVEALVATGVPGTAAPSSPATSEAAASSTTAIAPAELDAGAAADVVPPAKSAVSTPGSAARKRRAPAAPAAPEDPLGDRK
jgi:serine/threonine-protein kinase